MIETAADSYDEICNVVLSSPIPREGLAMPRGTVLQIRPQPAVTDEEAYARLVRELGAVPLA